MTNTAEARDTDSNADAASLLLRFPASLKVALLAAAAPHRRSLTAEIIVRLQRSLEAPADKPYQSLDATVRTAALRAMEPSSVEDILLDAFRQLPPEKQLALISLLR